MTHDRTRVAALADEHFERQCALDPVRATLSGAVGFDAALPDYSPDGWAARAEHCRGTLARLPSAAGGLAGVLVERLTAEAEHAEAGLAASLNIVVSPPTLIRECLLRAPLRTEADAAAAASRLRAVPEALEGYAGTLVEQVRRGRAASRTQAQVVAGACRAWASAGLFDGLADPEGAASSAALRRALPSAVTAATAAYHEFAEVIERSVLPDARPTDGVGAEDYRVAARHVLGADIDPAETAAWLTAELAELTAATAALAGGDLRARCAELDEDPAWAVTGADELRGWLRDQLDLAADLVAGRIVRVPDALRELTATVSADRADGPVRYLPPAADGSRPGQVVWSLPPHRDTVPVWRQRTAVHHEGVPGHHLQMGAAVLDGAMCAWQRHTVVPGHAEGWAVYAEGLVDDAGALDEPPARLGYLLGRQLNAAVALADLAVHAGTPLPGGADPLAFLAAHAPLAEHEIHFALLRNAAWPAQALAYACGERAWRAARATACRRAGSAFDQLAFHSRMLAIGPCGLDAITAAAG